MARLFGVFLRMRTTSRLTAAHLTFLKAPTMPMSSQQHKVCKAQDGAVSTYVRN